MIHILTRSTCKVRCNLQNLIVDCFKTTLQIKTITVSVLVTGEGQRGKFLMNQSRRSFLIVRSRLLAVSANFHHRIFLQRFYKAAKLISKLFHKDRYRKAVGSVPILDKNSCNSGNSCNNINVPLDINNIRTINVLLDINVLLMR